MPSRRAPCRSRSPSWMSGGSAGRAFSLNAGTATCGGRLSWLVPGRHPVPPVARGGSRLLLPRLTDRPGDGHEEFGRREPRPLGEGDFGGARRVRTSGKRSTGPESVPRASGRKNGIDVSGDQSSTSQAAGSSLVPREIRLPMVRSRRPIGTSSGWRSYVIELLPYEKELLDALFRDGNEVKVSELKTTFAERLHAVEQSLYEDAMREKWFRARPDHVRTRWAGRGVLLTVLGGGSHVGAGPLDALGARRFPGQSSAVSRSP